MVYLTEINNSSIKILPKYYHVKYSIILDFLNKKKKIS